MSCISKLKVDKSQAIHKRTYVYLLKKIFHCQALDFYRASACSARYCYNIFVCLSVRLSIWPIPVLCQNRWNGWNISSNFLTFIILVFRAPPPSKNSKGNPIGGGV